MTYARRAGIKRWDQHASDHGRSQKQIRRLLRPKEGPQEASTQDMWPALHVMSGRSFRRRDTAFRALRAAISEAMSGAGLQDEPVARELMQWADAMEQSTALRRPRWIITDGQWPFVFMLTRRD
jgi:hypothetical protein